MNIQEAYDLLETHKDGLGSLGTENLSAMLEAFEAEAASRHISQHSQKILINALYGAMANKHFDLANPDLAAGITSSGRFFIRLLGQNVEDTLQKIKPCKNKYLISGDTDSIYYTIEPIIRDKFENPNFRSKEVIDWCDKFEKNIIQKIIADTIDEYAEILNVYDRDAIGVEREIIADAAVFVAKKKYFARVADMEGIRFPEEAPYIKIMGLEVARSSTADFARDKLEEAINIMLDQDAQGVRVWRDGIKKEFLRQPITAISMTASASKVEIDEDAKGTPQGVKACKTHNDWVRKNNLEGEIPLLLPGEKYKRCYLKEPNIFGSEVIAYESDRIAQIIEEHGIYDYSKNFEKYVEKPLEAMVGQLGYNISNVATLDVW